MTSFCSAVQSYVKDLNSYTNSACSLNLAITKSCLTSAEVAVYQELERLAAVKVSKSSNAAVRPKPMRVLVLGSARTGTTSMLTALNMLGYRTYHMHELFKHPWQFDFWIQAIRLKFGGVGKADHLNFDKVFADYDAISDVPAVLFTPELLATYPDAKVILTTRDPAKWVDSMQSTIWRAHTWWSWDVLSLFNPGLISGFRTMDTLIWDAFINSSPGHLSCSPKRRDYMTNEYRKTAATRFEEHNNLVRSLVPADNLLEFQPQMGWKPLCEFLGQPVSAGEYPRSNQKDDHVKKTTKLWYIGLHVALFKAMTGCFVSYAIVWFGWKLQ